MSILLTDSFDTTTTILDRVADWTEITGGGSSIELGAYGRFSTNGLRIHRNDTNGIAAAIKFLPSSKTTLIIAFSLEATELPNGEFAFLHLGEASGDIKHLTFSLDASLDLRVRRGSRTGTQLGSTVVGAVSAINTPTFFEIKVTIDDASGSVEINSAEGTATAANIFSVSSVDTRNGGDGVIDEYVLGEKQTGNAFAWQYDDLVVIDTSGSPSDFLGNRRVLAGFPSANGNYAQFTPDSGDNFENIDETDPDDDTTKNASSAVGNKDSFTFPNADSATFTGVVVTVRARKSAGGLRTFRALARHGGTDGFSSAVALGSSWAYYSEFFENNPSTGSPWTLPQFNAAEFGYEVES